MAINQEILMARAKVHAEAHDEVQFTFLPIASSLDHSPDSTGDKGACLGLSWPLIIHCPIAKMPHNSDVPAWLLSRVANCFSVKQKNSGKLSALQDE
ncbi:predicted protein [Sclerotinia sclerotiorum 1980 UF-70]|uniref:Uncharacterized protein n=2 Tax=Sclerotinia sclerotiorum (strain ATCC 18683 / 1980 / Ss-1) TaxID=665079 RepID=A7ERW4_SCLS1|nr:predicted protein [Sclerotinia sclerotiorum 1980 UF-70]APA13346.1 hypothetical protein sscle_11g081160 [Sclerotinia sclerotiorum 1980 UF-70]EDN92206.1 predicted protein [Sclerotinia sclerotiorum 1980 UF-70]